MNRSYTHLFALYLHCICIPRTLKIAWGKADTGFCCQMELDVCVMEKYYHLTFLLVYPLTIGQIVIVAANDGKLVTIQNGWNNRISYGCVYAQIRSGLGMHLGTYSNHDTVLFLLIVPIKGRFVWDGIHCICIYQRLHIFLILLEYLGNLVRFSIYKGWNFPFLLGDILNIPMKGSI